MVENLLRLRAPLDLRLTLWPLHHGGIDPTMRIGPDGVWRATRTPEGAATVHLALGGGRSELRVQAWGPGAAWAVERVPDLVGERDDVDGFRPGHPLVAELHRRHPGLRMCRSHAVVEALVPTIIEQKVVGLDAKQSYAWLAKRCGEAAPGPSPGGAGLLLPPSPEWLARLPSWDWHRGNVERGRAETVRRACASARRLEETIDMAPADAERRLRALPGIGPWSSAKVREAALGDADAVAVGDYHFPHMVSWALAGERRGDDARMLELLAPWEDQRQRARVVRLLVLAAVGTSSAGGSGRRGPRMPRQDIRAL
ncbi:MAG TPA: hypothetical protein VFA94_12180 [Acidimicrobiales bacterium]|nr:hypothetical protein [Acidimicrobiales bacterium]